MRAIFFFSGIIFLLSSCVKNNPDPSWIEVNEWTLVENPNAESDQGVLTHNITDAWVYIDNEFIGVFEVPFKVPVIKEGNVELKIYPTIHNNGISATKRIYPFIEAYVAQVDLVQNETLTVDPVTQYKENTDFWIEDFEDPTFLLQDGNASLASLERITSSPVLDQSINEGGFGRVTLDETNYIYIGTTTANSQGTLNMPIPLGQEVYLEIDYHITQDLTTGVLAINSSGATDHTYIRINKSDPSEVRWKKIYIDLRETIAGASSGTDYYEFSFNALLEEGYTSGEINIDNIKAVYF